MGFAYHIVRAVQSLVVVIEQNSTSFLCGGEKKFINFLDVYGMKKQEKKQLPQSEEMCNLRKQEVLDLLQKLSNEIISLQNHTAQQQNQYVQQRVIINNAFQCTSSHYDLFAIITRLTIIDSLYSTNARYSYFSIEEMANAIYSLGNEKNASDYFYSIACGGKDAQGLFCRNYGIRKNLNQGNLMMSLLSKYAFFALSQNPTAYPLGFPIYDSLVCNVYTRACKVLCATPAKNIQANIENYVAALEVLRNSLFGTSTQLFHGMQQFDILDAYLWRMGKIDNGNFSLLLNKQDYSTFIANINLVNSPLPSSQFDNEVLKQCKQLGKQAFNNISPTIFDLFNHWNNNY